MLRISLVFVLLILPLSGAQAMTTEALMDTIQHAGFDFFWEEANPVTGLIKDRNTPGSVASIASTGFGLTAYTVGVDRGWVSRSDAADRVLMTLNTFWNGPQGTAVNGTIGYKGLYYHWLDMWTARAPLHRSRVLCLQDNQAVAGARLIHAPSIFATAVPGP